MIEPPIMGEGPQFRCAVSGNEQMVGGMQAQLVLLQRSVDRLTDKVDDLMAAKNQGKGILLVVATLAGIFGAFLREIMAILVEHK